jgi:hypothetical protein
VCNFVFLYTNSIGKAKVISTGLYAAHGDHDGDLQKS